MNLRGVGDKQFYGVSAMFQGVSGSLKELQGFLGVL